MLIFLAVKHTRPHLKSFVGCIILANSLLTISFFRQIYHEISGICLNRLDRSVELQSDIVVWNAFA